VTRLYIGTDASRGGAGLHLLSRSAANGWVRGDPLSGVRNASFATYSARHDLHYLTDEQEDGAIVAGREIGRSWQQVARVATHGAGPTYVALDADEDRLAVANYDSGSIAVFCLDRESGVPIDRPDARQHHGSGPIADRQDGPHAHCVRFSPDGRWLYHVDLGTDQVRAYPIEAGGTIGERQVAFAAPAGSGPRHLVFHPERRQALLVSELVSTLTVLNVGDGTLAATATRSTLPEGYAGESLAGHLSLDGSGTRIYVTNRGHDSIAVFGWDTDRTPDLLQHVPSGGASPRAFVLLEAERQLVVANEEAGSVGVFDVLADGTLSSCRHVIAVPGAVFPFVASR
jgi:6-phosphogluconolactonase